MLLIANKSNKRGDTKEKRKIFFPSKIKSLAVKFRENFNDCILYKFLEVAGHSGIYKGFISFFSFQM